MQLAHAALADIMHAHIACHFSLIWTQGMVGHSIALSCKGNHKSVNSHVVVKTAE